MKIIVKLTISVGELAFDQVGRICRVWKVAAVISYVSHREVLFSKIGRAEFQFVNCISHKILVRRLDWHNAAKVGICLVSNCQKD